MSNGSKPVTTIGTPYLQASGSYSGYPMTVQTWPAARNPWTRLCGRRHFAGGLHRCQRRIHQGERLLRPLFAATQPHDSLLLARIDDQMKTSETFHRDDHAAVNR